MCLLNMLSNVTSIDICIYKYYDSAVTLDVCAFVVSTGTILEDINGIGTRKAARDFLCY